MLCAKTEDRESMRTETDRMIANNDKAAIQCDPERIQRGLLFTLLLLSSADGDLHKNAPNAGFTDELMIVSFSASYQSTKVTLVLLDTLSLYGPHNSWGLWLKFALEWKNERETT